MSALDLAVQVLLAVPLLGLLWPVVGRQRP
jgi:hypothetical protein